MQMLARDIVSIDDFLSHLNIPPVPTLHRSNSVLQGIAKLLARDLASTDQPLLKPQTNLGV